MQWGYLALQIKLRIAMIGKNRIMIFGPKDDGTYVVSSGPRRALSSGRLPLLFYYRFGLIKAGRELEQLVVPPSQSAPIRAVSDGRAAQKECSLAGLACNSRHRTSSCVHLTSIHSISWRNGTSANFKKPHLNVLR